MTTTSEPLKNFGYVLASKMLVNGNKKVRFMYRENSDGDDSGWRFFCGDETQDYTDNPDNIGIYDVQTILDRDGSILPFLNASTGSAFERQNENDGFLVVDFNFEEDD